MMIPSWLKKRPRRDVKPSSLSAAAVHEAPTDPTLDNAAMEISQSIKDKAGKIASLSREIEAMTTDLLKQFEAQSNVSKK